MDFSRSSSSSATLDADTAALRNEAAGHTAVVTVCASVHLPPRRVTLELRVRGVSIERSIAFTCGGVSEAYLKFEGRTSSSSSAIVRMLLPLEESPAAFWRSSRVAAGGHCGDRWALGAAALRISTFDFRGVYLWVHEPQQGHETVL